MDIIRNTETTKIKLIATIEKHSHHLKKSICLQKKKLIFYWNYRCNAIVSSELSDSTITTKLLLLNNFAKWRLTTICIYFKDKNLQFVSISPLILSKKLVWSKKIVDFISGVHTKFLFKFYIYNTVQWWLN